MPVEKPDSLSGTEEVVNVQSVLRISTVVPTRKLLGKQVYDLCFIRDVPDSSVYTCRCGVRRKRTGKSYQNLLSHVQTADAAIER